jgi:DNA polymerase-1
VKQLLLSRLPGDLVQVDVDGEQRRMVAADQLAEFVRTHELEHPRWIWDDTGNWYPNLLRHGVRVQRCLDLRLCHNIFRRSPFVDQSPFAGDESAAWDTLKPAVEATPSLFRLQDLGEPLDVIAEYARQMLAVETSRENRRLKLLLAAESAGALTAAEMTHFGLPWRTERHERLLVERLGPRPSPGRRPQKLEQLLAVIRDALRAPDLNPDSPGELLHALHVAGVDVPDTRSWRLQREDHPAIPALLEYKKLSRLLHANGWNWIDTWINAGRFRSQLLVGAVVTGRWAARGGGALQFPAELREAVVADAGWKLVVADVAQLEPRVLAGCSGDVAMAQAARATDLYEGMVASGAVPTRNDAKLGLLGAMYGATSGEGGRMAERMTTLYPNALAHVEAAARAGERGDVVHTLLGRGSPRPNGDWMERSPDDITEQPDPADRRAWGRFTRNFVIQGTGAEWALCWLAELRNRLFQLGGDAPLPEMPHLAFFLHDEVIIHTPAYLAGNVAGAVQTAASRAGRLLFDDFAIDFPLDVSVVDCWADAV